MRMLMVIVAILIVTGAATLHADQVPERGNAEPKKPAQGVQVQSSMQGRISITGPDGKTTVHTFGDQAGPPGRPEKEEQSDGKPAMKTEQTWSFNWGKAFRLKPDGSTEVLDEIPKQVAEKLQEGAVGGVTAHGAITVISPDGRVHTQTFDGKDALHDVLGMIEKLLADQGDALPQDVRDKLGAAIASHVQKEKSPVGLDAVSRKLDTILERLEKLERDVAELKPGAVKHP